MECDRTRGDKLAWPAHRSQQAASLPQAPSQTTGTLPNTHYRQSPLPPPLSLCQRRYLKAVRIPMLIKHPANASHRIGLLYHFPDPVSTTAFLVPCYSCPRMDLPADLPPTPRPMTATERRPATGGRRPAGGRWTDATGACLPSV